MEEVDQLTELRRSVVVEVILFDNNISEDVIQLTLSLIYLVSPAPLILRQCLVVRLDRIIFLVLVLEMLENMLLFNHQEEMELLF